MNTLTHRTPTIDSKHAKDNVILLEDLEFNMSRKQLAHITELHNSGMSYEDISKEVKRNKFEVILALLHQAKTNNVKLRPFAYRKKGRK